MFSDLFTFFTALPAQLSQTGDFLPESFDRGTAYLSVIGNYIENLDSTYKMVGISISLIIALLGCFFGFKLSKLFMSLTGFFTGAIIGGIVGVKFLNLSGILIALAVIICGLLLAFFAYRIYQAGIFILCFGLAFMAGASFLPFTGDIQFFLSVLIGFGIGALALKFIRPVIICTSAIVCGFSAAGLLITVCETMGIYSFSIPQTLLAIIISVLGIAVQFLTTTDKTNKKHKH
ncbi:MAG: hypothetical protein PUH88_04910 [Lachnospiraceae bacterium]|nr:hypothetical protein [Lachnospiraceae bacterium]